MRKGWIYSWIVETMARRKKKVCLICKQRKTFQTDEEQ